MRVCVHCGLRSDEDLCPKDGLPMVDEAALERAGSAPPLIGRVFGERYLVESLIGQGGMGWVFRATHRVMGHAVALKVMRHEALADRAAVKRFFLEARACSHLRQSHTIKVHDFGMSPDGHPYLVMEFLRGEGLDRVLARQKRLPARHAARIVAQVCRSLTEAHAAGLVHRDLKPANIWLADIPGEEPPYVKVLDFGIAKSIAATGDEESLTASGAIIGTPRYMSPEQILRRPLDGRSDLYSLGVILFEMLAGRPPFSSPASADLFVMQVRTPAPDLAPLVAEADLPPELMQVVKDLLAKDPDARPASALEALARLRDLEPLLPSVGGPPERPVEPRGAGSTAGVAAADRHTPLLPEWLPSGLAPTTPLGAAPEITEAAPAPVPGGTSQHSTETRPRVAPGDEHDAESSGALRRWPRWAPAAVIAAGALVLILLVIRGLGGGDAGAVAPEARAPSATARYDPAPGAASPEWTPRPNDAGTAEPAESDAAGVTGSVTPLLVGAAEPVDADATADTADTAPATDAGETDLVVENEIVRVDVLTRPAGAEVWLEGRRVGQTPYRLEGPRGGSAALRLHMDGYQERAETVELGEAGARRFDLEREPPPRTPRRDHGDARPAPGRHRPARAKAEKPLFPVFR